MSKKFLTFTALVSIAIACCLFIFKNTALFDNFDISSAKNYGNRSEFGDYLVVQNLSLMNNFSVPERIEIDTLNSKLGNFILISHLINDNTERAIANAYKMYEIDNNNIYAASIILMDYIQLAEFAEMDEFIDKLRDDNNNKYVLDLVYAWGKLAQGQTDEAFEVLEYFDAEGFEDLYYVHKAMMYEVVGKYDEALDCYESALDEKVSLRTIELAARLYIKTDKKAMARNIVEKYIHLRPESDMAQAFKKYITDEKNVKKITEKNMSYIDGFAEVFFNVGFVNQVRFKPNLSVLFSKIAILINPKLDFARMTLANIFASINQKKLIIQTLKHIDKNSYLYDSAQGYIAESFYAMDEYDKALKIYKKLIDGGTSNLNHYINIAEIYKKQMKLDEALKIYNFIFSQLPKNADGKFWVLYFNRGVLYDRMKNWEAAEKDLTRALDGMPNNPVILNYLGYSWVDKNINIQKGTKMIEKAVTINPRNESFIDSLGWALYKSGSYGLATRILEMGKNINSTHPVLNDHLGDAYLEMGRVHEAVYSWKKALFYNKSRAKFENSGDVDVDLQNIKDIEKKIKKYELQIF